MRSWRYSYQHAVCLSMHEAATHGSESQTLLVYRRGISLLQSQLQICDCFKGLQGLEHSLHKCMNIWCDYLLVTCHLNKFKSRSTVNNFVWFFFYFFYYKRGISIGMEDTTKTRELETPLSFLIVIAATLCRKHIQQYALKKRLSEDSVRLYHSVH